MKTEVERILEQVHRSYAADAWHGPSVSEALLGVDAATAAFRAAPGTHSIAEIARHVEHTQQVVLQRIQGRGRLTGDEENWPTVPDPLSDAEWSAIRHRLHLGAAALERAMSAFPLEQLEAPLVDGGTSASNNMLGHAQHNAYHAGQIMLIKKLLQTLDP